MGEGSAVQATPASLPSVPFRPHTVFVLHGRSGRLLSLVVAGSLVRECMLGSPVRTGVATVHTAGRLSVVVEYLCRGRASEASEWDVSGAMFGWPWSA